jgi:hypothetical protein
MSGPEHEHEGLRRAFAAPFRTAHESRDCPPSERLWESARGSLDRQEDDEIIRHVGECSACAAAWRAARELTAGEVAPAVSRTRLATRLSWVAAAAAVVLVALIWIPGTFEREEGPPAFRAWEGEWLQPTFEESAALPGERCVLRWVEGPEGTTYEVRVTTEDLRVLAVGRDLDRAEFHVPGESIAELPPGSSIVWQVTARLPAGRTVESSSFVTPLE